MKWYMYSSRQSICLIFTLDVFYRKYIDINNIYEYRKKNVTFNPIYTIQYEAHFSYVHSGTLCLNNNFNCFQTIFIAPKIIK